MMRIVFMGTPDFAVGPLKGLYEAGYEICGVVTRKDKPKGRGMKLTPSPVKQFALEHQMDVYQPAGLRNQEAYQWIADKNPDLIVVVAYGRILPKEILELPRYGCINVHASLLPELRGAAPIQWSIINGLSETGVTTMFMSEGLDEGDMIYQRKTPISDSDNAETLHDRLMVLGTECILETVKDLENGEIPRIQQDSQFATYAPMIQKSDAEINWNDSDRNICNLIRGMNPHPGAWTTIQKNLMRIYEAVPGPSADAAPGTVVCTDVKKGIIVACGNQGSVVLTRIQMAGGKAMNACDYLRGHQIPEGISLGRDSE